MRYHTMGRQLLAFLLICFTCAGSAAWALAFTPIEMTFSPSGRGATQIYRIENTTAEVAAVEIYAKHREMQQNGEDKLVDADDDFNIFPAQMVLQPGQAQTVRVQYVGAADLKAEKSYRVIAEQLPIDIGQPQQDGGRMRLLVKYVSSAYVAPAGVRPSIKLLQSRWTQEEDKRWLEVLVGNEGTAHKILKDIKLKIANTEIQGAALKGFEGENVLSQSVRWFRIAAPAGINNTQGLQLIVP